MPDAPLRDRAVFWVAAAGVLAVLGTVPLALGGAEALDREIDPLLVGWIQIGLAIELVAAVALWWAITLQWAHGHAAQHWGPDPKAHRLPEKATPEDSEPQLRSVLRQVRRDITGAVGLLDKAVKTGRYWGPSEAYLEDGAWKKNRDQLGTMAGMNDLYDSLTTAFEHVARIKPLVLRRWVQGGRIQPTDNLEGAVVSLRSAQSLVQSRLDSLDSTQREVLPPARVPHDEGQKPGALWSETGGQFIVADAPLSQLEIDLIGERRRAEAAEAERDDLKTTLAEEKEKRQPQTISPPKIESQATVLPPTVIQEPSMKQRHAQEFESEGKALVYAGQELGERVRRLPEDADEAAQQRAKADVTNYEVRIQAFFDKWGEGMSIMDRIGASMLPQGERAIVPGPAWRRLLVDDVEKARDRVNRRLERAQRSS